MQYRAYKPRTWSTLLITRCIMAKFLYFRKAKFHYFKQVDDLSATCFHVELEQFLACFRVARVRQRHLGFLVLLCFALFAFSGLCLVSVFVVF